MKRIFSLTMVFMLTIMALMPVQGLAQEDKALEQAIRIVRAKIQVPESFTEFNYNASSDGQKSVWYLDWSSKDKLEGSINVRVDQDGTILSYNFYKPDDYDGTRKFPKISRQQARVTAEAFIDRMIPGLVSNLRLMEDSQLLEMGYSHRFNYIRLVNGIPYYSNTVNVEVNSETGQVRSFNYNWTDQLDFPQSEGVISMEDAGQAYKEELGLKLMYQYNYDGQDSRVYAVYTPVYDTNYGIDAFSGERIKVNPYYYGLAQGMGMERAAMDKADGGMQLTPEEQKAVDQVSALLTKERAESIARGIKELEIPRDHKVNSAYLQKGWDVNEGYTWELYFTKEVSSRDSMPSNIWVQINAESGELKSYSRYLPTQGDEEGKYTEAQAKAAVDKFINAVHRVKSEDMEFDPIYEGHYYPLGMDKNPASYSFRYFRKVNGIQFPGNSMYVSFDAVNGKVTSFSMNWYDIEFPSVENALDMEEVYDSMFAKVGLELQYTNIYPEEYAVRHVASPKPEIKLVYSVKPGKPLVFDANSGEMLDYSGKPYQEQKAVEYTDIAGHFAQNQITALAEYGIALPGTEFKPDQNIIQKDFLGLLVKTMGYYGSWQPFGQDDREIDEMYNLLIREGVVTKEEKNPTAVVTRQDGIKYIIRSLKYGQVADIKGIFITGFKDQGSISPELVGYVAIAKGLGIIGGSSGYFYPANSLTRAETAVMLYNHLTR